MKVKQAMITECPTILPEESTKKAAEAIKNCGVDVAVVDKVGELVGIIANEDVLPISRERRNITKVESVMSTNLVVTHPEETLEQALELLVVNKVAVLPVVDEKSPTKLLGLVTRSSIIEAYESEARKMVGGVYSI
jgi:CIC family chloride channel protein